MNQHSFEFIETEHTLSRKSGQQIQHPIRVFSLDGIGVDRNALIELLAKNVGSLKWDHYDVRKKKLEALKKYLPDHKQEILRVENDYYLGISDESVIEPFKSQLKRNQLEEVLSYKPHRRRSICQFYLTLIDESWDIERFYDVGFSQSVEDYRLEERVFEQTDETTSNHPLFRALLRALANMTLEFRPEAKKLKLVAHEMATVTRLNVPGDNSPEGIHQDGSEFIVSALVIERKAVREGRSHIYGPDKSTKYLDYILKPGEGVFQADKDTNMWHRVTSIYLDEEAQLLQGERNIIGFDIDVIG